MSKMVNVCTEIKCPYSYATSPALNLSGCRRYRRANHQCHLVCGGSHPELEKVSSEYFLNAYPDSVNIPELKIQNDSYFLDNLENRKPLENAALRGGGILYGAYSEETFDLFDLVAFLNQ